MQWMIMASVMPCHALHALQHAATSPFEPLNQIIYSAPAAEADFT